MTKCEYCGKDLEPMIVCLRGKEFPIAFKDCGCEESVKERQKQEASKAEAAKQVEINLLVKQFEKSGIPKRYAGCEKLVENLEELYKTALEGGLYLWGTTGTGKTTIAAAIGIRAIKNGLKVQFVNAYDISQKLFDRDDQFVTDPDLLIIDDLGAEAVGEWNNARLRSAINDRYNSMKPTVITSNYSKKDLAKLLKSDNKTAEAIYSRLSEMTVEKEISGKDYRRVRSIG